MDLDGAGKRMIVSYLLLLWCLFPQELDDEEFLRLAKVPREHLKTLAEDLLDAGAVVAARQAVYCLEYLDEEPQVIELLLGRLSIREAEERSVNLAKLKSCDRQIDNLSKEILAIWEDADSVEERRYWKKFTSFIDHGYALNRDGKETDFGGTLHDWGYGKAIHDALATARRLSISVKEVEPQDSSLLSLQGLEIAAFEYEGLRYESVWPREHARHMFQEVLRAMAFSNWLATSELAPDPQPGVFSQVITQQQYWDYLLHAQESGRIDSVDFERFKQVDGAPIVGLISEDGVYLERLDRGGHQEFAANMLLLFDGALPTWQGPPEVKVLPVWMAAGHANFVSHFYFHAGMRPYRGQNPYGTEDRETPELTDRDYRNAGWSGMQSWLRQKSVWRKDPQLSQNLVEKLSHFYAEPLVKVTSIVGYLHASGRFQATVTGFENLFQQERDGEQSRLVHPAERLEYAVQQDVPKFEQEWRLWMLGSLRGNVQRLRRPVQASKEVMLFLEEWNDFRASHDLHPVSWNSELSGACEAHLSYLKKNLKKKSRYDRRYQDSEAALFNPFGALAGVRSFFSDGGTKRALEQGLGHAFDRAAFLHPGILEAGIALQGKHVVVDSRSMTDPGMNWVFYFPRGGQEKVPRRHSSGTSPVPEVADAAKLGYPISLHFGAHHPDPHIPMELLQVKGQREIPVACYFMSPAQPIHPHWFVPGMYALIPKAPLQANALYRVQAKLPDQTLTWTFRTSK